MRPFDQCNVLSGIANKAVITLGPEISSNISMSINWFQDLLECFEHVNSFVRVCWLKTIVGGWTTTSRMHESVRWPCIFGCIDCRDELLHYLICPFLWQFPREHLKCEEPSISIGSRLCFVAPTIEKLRTLAFVHALYHHLKKNPKCVRPDGSIQHPRIVLNQAQELSRLVVHLCGPVYSFLPPSSPAVPGIGVRPVGRRSRR